MESQPNNRQHCVFHFLRNCGHQKKTGSFQGDRVPSVTSAGRIRGDDTRIVQQSASVWMQMQENNLAGHTIDRDLLLHDGVLGIDRHAVGQETIFVGAFHAA